MKKSFFLKTFKINGYLLTLLAMLAVVNLPIRLIVSFLKSEPNPSLIQYTQFLYEWLSIGLKWLDGATEITALILFLLVLPELISRLTRDSLINWGKSIWLTYRLRKFLLRKVQFDDESDSTVALHNKSIRSAIIDIREDTVVFLMKLPNDYQAQKSVIDTRDILREEISNRFPYYVFSNFDRFKNWLQLEGTNFH
ncbi:hypothetical protein EGW69_01715 [Enterococcus faecium]|uniref:hypothetical protein n=1 Tax=Bacilli TaxID=91061 RepID=UPI00057F416D|nr:MULTISPECIES: hypothetical protein [Bacilli]EMF0314974.1 hypothetical protein [Enterococcus faecium]EAC2320151.1 hypothetical protein [Listeria monocytogenes]EAC3859087.1 hypothetical protein [Listeria monocytogenes]EAC5419035.1 hypothetical protein [Listeria monocytogenes]EAC5447722.1 hypothetical protein [Listeria monocytogenes]